MNGFLMQCKIELLRTVRNRRFIIASLMMPILFYYIFTNVVNNAPDTKAWQAQYMISMAAFSVIGSAFNVLGIRLVQEQSFGWTKQLRITPLPAGAYLTAKMIAQTFINALSVIVIFLAGFLINDVELSAWQWLSAGLWIILAAVPFLALGTIIGLMKKIDTAAAISSILYLCMSVLGGLWMPIEIFPKTLQKIGEWLPTYRFGHGAWNIAAGKAPDLQSMVVLAGYLLVFVVMSLYIRKRQEAI
ncbi:ABC transporter permease [Ectobacillus ponti]|uniref:ABC transporter permease n=1 Tax=Ectobacillus ponti TaxID=2961894 RepID=A0AA42BNR6_9BACI|nr:ABC transporter permease [Ectobacillus ponti]MCP8967977.1 ABC transporter permease [Ectobacillus ponti]